MMLPPDATLNSIRDGLEIEYVRSVLERLMECERSLGDAQVTIAVTGGSPPAYSIDAVMDLGTGETTNWERFDGKRHRPLTSKCTLSYAWSVKHNTVMEVRSLIGEMRGFKKR